MAIPKWYTRALTGGEVGRDVRVVQSKLGIASGVYDHQTQSYVRGFQQLRGLEPDGVVGPLTAAALGESADSHLPPEWFTRDLRLGLTGADVSELRQSLGLPAGPRFDDDTRRAVLRFQSARKIPLTGTVDRHTAVLMP